jgi:hypothetical protein
LALLCDLEKYSNSTPNSNLLRSTRPTQPTNTITTGLIEYMVAVVGNTAEGTINDHEAKVEVLVEVHFEVIARRNATIVRNRIAG